MFGSNHSINEIINTMVYRCNHYMWYNDVYMYLYDYIPYGNCIL